ncbi:PAS domain-containing sensor histidine kinase [Kaistia algarum]|uniref:PAS domain-containing sensor histidine kinase n=1 Tax=Kaistia algarum TaxID=2083279 RepID=UPI000CE8185C|nr:PAS domain-containing sensor histidine kinase [Kaistia algarum]MCX5512158.1 PAS domain-containing sensor histidine kinase [Kaistia algarum]PPE80259.1 PAS domain-containing sensor histidine kinase [Kaistia algarum]
MTFSPEPVLRILDGMVHESVGSDMQRASRHRAFLAGHLLAGLLALLAPTLFLAVAGRPQPETAVAFLWLLAPLPIAAFLSRTGRLEAAHLLSSGAFAGFLAYLAVLTGGILSPVLIWLAVVPAEAALSGSRRITIAGSALAALALLAVAAIDFLGPIHVPILPDRALAITVLGGAILYAGGLALRIQRIHARAEKKAREGAGRYRLLADNATDLITRHGVSGDVEFASPAARAIVGCASADLMGDGLFNRVHVADRPKFLQALSEADRTGKAVSAEFRLRRGDLASRPEFIWLEMRCRPAIDPADAGRTLVAVTRDVTVRKEYEAAFEDARAEAEQASHAKGQFLANMSHELRTPLNAIIGFSDMLQQDMAGKFDAARKREYARLIHASGEHLLEVVNSILDMSKIEAGRFEVARESFALGPVVDASLEMVSHQASVRSLTLVRDVQADLPEIVADRRACRQILVNLLSNAVKFTEAGGRVSVVVRLERNHFVIEVSDNGIGISAADLPRIGTPFLQADANYDRRYEGTGLGLSVVKGLVALHGGSLSITSVLGRGTTVSIRLPAGVVAIDRAPVDRIQVRERKIA